MGHRPRRLAVFAFGTRGDVLPVAVVASALAISEPSFLITFITHEAHRNMEPHLLRSGVARFLAVSAPPVVPGCTWEEDEKSAREGQLREDCISAMDSVMAGGGDDEGGVMINLFALEGWHLAELYRLPCAVLAPYVVPYSAAAAFERGFRVVHPLLYRRLKEAEPGEVGWAEVMHWMWPLFTDRWGSWRMHRLHLSACPLTDPVTDLPLMHEWPRASPLLYGFSPQVVEIPAYWPRSVSVCGFWFAPLEWEVRDVNPELMAAPEATGIRSSTPREVPLDPVGRNSLLPTSFCPSEDLRSGMHTGRDFELLENRLRARRPETSIGHCPSPQTKSGRSDGGDLRRADEGVYDSSIAIFYVAMEESDVVKTQENPDLTESLSEKTRSPDQSQAEQNSPFDGTEKTSYTPPVKLSCFLSDHTDPRPIFVGLSSMGSMGFLPRPDSFLLLLEAVLEATNSCAILLTAGHPPLDLAVSSHCDEKLPMQTLEAAAEQTRKLWENRACIASVAVSSASPAQSRTPGCSPNALWPSTTAAVGRPPRV